VRFPGATHLVILSRGYAAEALNWTRGVMKRIGLTLNETKTSIKQARREQFDFLGYTFGPWRYRKTGALYLGTSPSKKSVSRLRRKVGGLLKPGNVGAWHKVRDQLLLLVDRFRVVRRIAHGGMGVVYEAYDQKLGRRIALKCARVGHDRHLRPEVRLATEVSHPNICKIYEIHATQSSQGPLEFFTMELLEGPTLSNRLKEDPPLSPHER
jgi:RNA-directed DNA polymerase